ncbi:MAG: hypothetical protein IID45_00680 [Planctomycetes bacterium]|nr:hypothetical protein [Planctomycetota bacterium]
MPVATGIDDNKLSVWVLAGLDATRDFFYIPAPLSGSLSFYPTVPPP